MPKNTSGLHLKMTYTKDGETVERELDLQDACITTEHEGKDITGAICTKYTIIGREYTKPKE